MHIVQAQHNTSLQECEAAVPVPIALHGSHLRSPHNRVMQAETGGRGEGDNTRPALPANAGLP